MKGEGLPHQSSPAPEAGDSVAAFHEGPDFDLKAVRREPENLLLNVQTPLSALRPPDDAVVGQRQRRIVTVDGDPVGEHKALRWLGFGLVHVAVGRFRCRFLLLFFLFLFMY